MNVTTNNESTAYAVNELPVRDMAESTTGCCPPFNPAEWDNKTFIFDKKLFVKFTTRSIFHIPLNMNSMMLRVAAQVEEADATSPDNLMLSYDVSPWRAEHYLAISKEIPGADMVRLSGTYMTKVFEGPYKNMRQWHSELLTHAISNNKKPIKTYFNYTMCPNCAEIYGHNYVVGFEQVA